MEENIKKEIMKSVDAIKHKITTMKNQEHEINLSLDKILKPVTVPLRVLTSNTRFPKKIASSENISFEDSLGFQSADDLNTSNSCASTASSIDFYNDIESTKHPVNENFEISLENDDIYSIYDGVNVPFGVRTEKRNLMIGNAPVTFTKNLNEKEQILVKIGSKTFNLTPGLKELLLRKKPDLSLISRGDKLNYKDILQYTNAHKRDFNPKGQIKGDKGIKYRDIIKPLFSEKDNKTVGGNLPKLKKYKSDADLIYWDDPNELVERLKLLVASKDAGNTNHDNEILSIIEELKEAHIIKE